MLDIYIFKNEKYEFNDFITDKKIIISIKELPDQQIAYVTKDNYIVFLDISDIKLKKEIKLKINNNIIDNQSMLIYNNYLLIAGDGYINLINYASKNTEVLSFFLCKEITKIIDFRSDILMIALYDSDRKESIIRELNININEKNQHKFECIGEGFCDNKKIENIIKINTHKIITKIKDNPFLIWEKKEKIFENYIPSYIKNEEKKEIIEEIKKEEKENKINEIKEDIKNEDKDKNEKEINKIINNKEMDISDFDKAISTLKNDLLKCNMNLKASIISNKQDEIEKNKNDIKRINTEMSNLIKEKNEKIITCQKYKRSETYDSKKIEKQIPNAYNGYIESDINKKEEKKENKNENKKANLEEI